MIEKKFIEAKKQEYEINKFIKSKFGKGTVSEIKIERTPVGEKIIIFTKSPGIVIGKKGEMIQEINDLLKKKFNLENPQIEVAEILEPLFDAQNIADEIALTLERFGPLSFKIIAYRMLEKIKEAGALGAEIVLSGKLPSERAKTWRFAFGYLKKTGESEGVVRRAKATANTIPGTVGIKVSIVPKNVKIPDKIDLTEIKKEFFEREISKTVESNEEKIEKETKKEKARGRRKKKEKTEGVEKENQENKGENKVNQEEMNQNGNN